LHITKEVSVTVQIDQTAEPATLALDSEFDLDVTLVEVADPGHLINMTDDGCGQTCEKSTCISAA
jgi:FxLD family lantipeptide